MEVYIKGMGNISPQQTWDGSFLSQPLNYTGSKLGCVEPDYAQFIDVKQMRRMSRIIRMGVTAASLALRESGVSDPDAIITGTGYGCLDDTGIFLTKLIENKEQALNPTPFIQSTHNTIGSQIALLLHCQSYNQTYTHGAFSFEGALLDGILQLADVPAQSILIGGIDEITSISHKIQNRFRIFRQNNAGSLDLFKTAETGTINGEGSAFFVLSGIKEKNSSVCIKGVTTFYKPDRSYFEIKAEQFLAAAGLKFQDVDLLLLGKCGEPRYDKPMDAVVNDLFPSSSTGLFKHLCGEFPVASAFALWLGVNIIRHNHVPEIVMEKDKGRSLKNILIYNQYFGTHHSFILLQAC